MNWETLYQRLLRQFRLEDVVQEAILRTQLRLAAANDVKDAEAFAVGVARNIIRENLRRAQRHTAYQVAAAANRPTHAEPAHADLAAIKQKVLSASERKLFDAYFVPGKSPASRERLATKLGISVDTLYVRMHRLKQRVIDEYRREHGRKP